MHKLDAFIANCYPKYIVCSLIANFQDQNLKLFEEKTLEQFRYFKTHWVLNAKLIIVQIYTLHTL
jgi:hypothetical protein